jgi:tRNA A37 threonylcarbamoyladenosine modification protein TsaB
MATGAGLLAVGSLEAHAALALPLLQATGAGAVWVAHPSRRGEAYCALVGPHAEALAPAQPVVLAAGALPWPWPPRVLAVGAAVQAAAPLVPPGVQVVPLPHLLPSASGVLALAWAQAEKGLWQDALGYEPYYLKPVHTTPPRPAH